MLREYVNKGWFLNPSGTTISSNVTYSRHEITDKLLIRGLEKFEDIKG
jgi:hypothetical protein